MTSLTCPECGHRLPPPQDPADPSVTCPGCGKAVPVSPDPAPAPATAPAPPQGAATLPLGPPPPSSEPLWEAVVSVPGYEIVREVGRGGMGVVYEARDVRLNRTVALKMVLAGGHAGPEDVTRFLAEARAVAALQHPNVVQVFEAGGHLRLPYMALEFVGGGSLAERLAKGPLPPTEAARLLEQITQGIQAAHEQGIVHRDLKPANVLLQGKSTTDGTDPTDKEKDKNSSSVGSVPSVVDFLPKITDFGLAKRVEGGGLTRTGAVLGTPAYMAPEQARGEGKRVGPAADIYALGAILYECLTGQPPFGAATPVETILQVLNGDPVPPTKHQRRLPKDLETICLKCLEKEPSRRYASAQALGDDLRRWLRGEPITARPVGPLGRGWRWCKRNPAVAGLSAALLLLAVGAVVAIPWRAQRRAQPRSLNGLTAGMSAQQIQDHFRRATPAARLALLAEVPAELLKLRPVSRGDVSGDVRARGSVEPVDVSEVVAPAPADKTHRAIPLRIQWLVPNGASVKRGDKLAVIDEAPLRAKLKEQRAAVERAQTELRKAGRAKKQMRQFHESAVKLAKIDLAEAEAALKGFAGKDTETKSALARKAAQAQEKWKLAELQADKENARAELTWQQRKAALAQEQARVRDLEITLGRCTLVAPRDGTVLYWIPDLGGFGPLSPTVGAPVAPGQKLLFVFDPNRYRVKVNVSEQSVSRVRVGQPATVRIDAFPGRLFRGRTQAVAERGVRWPGGVKAFPVTVALDGDAPELRPAMSGEVTFLGESRRNVLRVPSGSVFSGAESARDRFCLVKTAGAFAQRQVVVGLSGDSFAEVVAGVREGEQVVDLRELAAELSKWLNEAGSR